MFLDVGNGHKIYYKEFGSHTGKPVVILHGGPGGGIQLKINTFFNLNKWRIIQFDQRGCGKSTSAKGPLYKNTTWDLVSDIEQLRQILNIEKWTVFGGSWGTTLALAYAEKHMEHITGFVLRGVSLLEQWETEWLYGPRGAARLFPEAWSKFAGHSSVTRKSKNLTQTFKSLLNSRNRTTRSNAAKSWYGWESSLSTLFPTPDRTPLHTVESIAILENHYFSHNAWIRPGQLLAVARSIPHSVPVCIIQGRYDMVCPPLSAVKVASVVRHATLIMTIAGHSAFDPGNAIALKKVLTTLE